MTQRNKVLSMLGLAARAGKVKSGEFSTEKAVKNGSARLVVAAEDASDNTKKLFSNMCEFYEVPFAVFGLYILFCSRYNYSLLFSGLYITAAVIQRIINE